MGADFWLEWNVDDLNVLSWIQTEKTMTLSKSENISAFQHPLVCARSLALPQVLALGMSKDQFSFLPELKADMTSQYDTGIYVVVQVCVFESHCSSASVVPFIWWYR